MNEQRIQDYVELIQVLLSCSSDQELTILQQHRDLLDKELLGMMTQVAKILRQKGQKNNASWLEQTASKLAQVIETTSTRPNSLGTSSELQMILQTLSQPSDLRDMAQRVSLCQRALSLVSLQENKVLWAALQCELGSSLYQNLQGDRSENIDAAILAYQESLRVRTYESMPADWALSMINLANAYVVRINGDRVTNIEAAISAYQQSLQVTTRETMPIEWAESMNNLATIYFQRIRGDRAENIGIAIRAYQESLQVRTREAMPIEWALSMNNLATAYVACIRGERAENIELAIQDYQESLQVRTREAMPIDWSLSMNNLALAYFQRIRGDRAENIEFAIQTYQESLQVRTREAMPIEWAESMNNLALAYSQRIRGDHAKNIEVSIATCQESLQVRTRATMPVKWAESMNSLAFAYSQRICGDHAENIEFAIATCQESLQVRTRATMPLEWAESINNIAFTYSQRIRGDRAENIEEAIKFYRESLQIRTREGMPFDWSLSMNNLAVAYTFRIRGDRAENIEEAIKFYRESLQIRTREGMPIEWAHLMNNLAATYPSRIRGDRAENIEEAIKFCRESLRVRTRETMPIDWALSMNNLALAYFQRIRGDRAENIETAIKAYQESLQVRTREDMPIEWAQSMNVLALAYSYRIRGDRAKNIEEAIEFYHNSLQVRTREDMPIEWAQSMNGLALAYFYRIRGDRAKNIETSICICEELLQVRTRDSMPLEWAESMNNLAGSYYSRTDGNREENIKESIKICLQSLEIFTPDANPRDCRRTARFLASLYVNERRWKEAQIIYQTALVAAEILYQATLSKDSQEVELSETSDLYRRAAYTYAKIGRLTVAIATLEQGRARGLSETLQRDRANLETIRQTNPDLVDRYQTAANAINQLESTERRLSTDSPSPQYSQEDFRQPATHARQSLKDCLTEIRQIPGYENFLSLPTFEDIAATVQPSNPLVYLVSTPNGSLALILTTEGVSNLWLNDLTEPQLLALLNDDWFKAYRESQTNRPAWFDTIDEVTHQLWNKVMGPLIDHLQKNNLSKAILIPTGYLSYLPLHAAWTPDNNNPNGRRYACDDIQFTYAPNALSLDAARTVAAQTSENTLLAINEPQPVNAGDLPSASTEAAKAISTFPGKGNWKLLQQENATRAAVLEQLPHRNTVHFSCHGSADFSTPLNSGLLMANNEILSLRDLLDLKLQNLRLAVLSACETGIPGTKLPDEVISLPTGLLQAGAAGVVSSLWSVADLSTMLLLSRFYDLWRNENLDPPEALHQAQAWLRNSNGPALVPYLKNSAPELVKKIAKMPNQYPFAHPFYWAAFTYVGV